MKSIYIQVKEQALPILEAYQNDLLKHDRDSLRKNKTPFIHITTKTGTYLEFMLPFDSESWPKFGEKVKYLFGYADRYHILDQKGSSIEHCMREQKAKLILYYDGFKLHKITLDKALEVMRSYKTKTKNQWRQTND